MVSVALAMIILGAVMNFFDWQTARARNRQEEAHAEAEAAADSINALAKLVTALKGAAQGTQLIVLGIVVAIFGLIALGVGSI
jgi:hypothetical protein